MQQSHLTQIAEGLASAIAILAAASGHDVAHRFRQQLLLAEGSVGPDKPATAIMFRMIGAQLDALNE